MTLRNLVSILVMVIALQACGFHLRGKIELPPTLESVFVESRDNKLAREVEGILEQSGAALVTAESAKATIDLFQVDVTRRVLTIDDRGKATSYTLRYEARFRVRDGAGESLLEDSVIAVEKDFTFDPNQVLQKEKEEDFLLEEMRSDLAQRIAKRISRGVV